MVLIARTHPAVAELARHGEQVAVGFGEDRIQTDHVAERVGDEDIELEAVETEHVAEATEIRRIGRTRILQMSEVVTLLEVDRGGRELAFLVDELRDTLVVQALEVEREDRTRRIAFHTETGARYEVDGTLVRHQVGHLLFQVRIDEVRRPAEVLGFDVAGRKSQLDTRRFQTGDVTVFHHLTADTLRVDHTDQVVVVTLVPVGCEADAVVQEAHVDTDVHLVLLLVSQLAVLQVVNRQTRLGNTGRRTPRVLLVMTTRELVTKLGPRSAVSE